MLTTSNCACRASPPPRTFPGNQCSRQDSDQDRVSSRFQRLLRRSSLLGWARAIAPFFNVPPHGKNRGCATLPALLREGGDFEFLCGVIQASSCAQGRLFRAAATVAALTPFKAPGASFSARCGHRNSFVLE